MRAIPQGCGDDVRASLGDASAAIAGKAANSPPVFADYAQTLEIFEVSKLGLSQAASTRLPSTYYGKIGLGGTPHDGSPIDIRTLR
jgi:hypothetical protein